MINLTISCNCFEGESGQKIKRLHLIINFNRFIKAFEYPEAFYKFTPIHIHRNVTCL